MGKGEAPAKLSKRQSAVLERIGVDIASSPSEAWRWIATRPGASLSSVSRCLFRMDGTPVSAVYARLLGDEKAFLRLEDWMIGRGYTRHVITDVAAGDDNLSLTYANLAWDTVPPKGGFEYGIRHTGVSMRYDAYVQNPPIIGLCIPKRLKACLGATDRMNDRLKSFVVAHTKKCDACGYCVQTDKSGKRAKAYIPVEYDAKTHNLCTYFPGCGYCWTSIDNALVDTNRHACIHGRYVGTSAALIKRKNMIWVHLSDSKRLGFRLQRKIRFKLRRYNRMGGIILNGQSQISLVFRLRP